MLEVIITNRVAIAIPCWTPRSRWRKLIALFPQGGAMSVVRPALCAAILAVGLVSSVSNAAPPNVPGTVPSVTSENVLTVVGGPKGSGGPSILYAPSNPDDPAYRAAIAGFTGGVVDYFDATLATPGLALLQNYDVVYTWVNSPLANSVGFGNTLADYVDGGGKVLLGAFCTYTVGNFLSGRIMNADYCPVISPTGGNHFSSMAYASNGTSYQHRNVTAYTEITRDVLDIQGTGVWDGTYLDGEIASAHSQNGRVMYFNGAGPGAGGTGDQARIVANFAQWQFLGGTMYAATAAGGYYGMNLRTGVATFVGNLPLGPTAEIDYDEVSGAAYMAAAPFGNRVHAFAAGTGAPIGAQVVTPAGTFSAIEAVLGTWFGCYSAAPCGPSSIASFDPTTGAILSGPNALGVGPVAGMTFSFELNRMFYATESGCPGGGILYWNSAPNQPLTAIGGLGFSPGAIEFGPDNNLYGVNVGPNSKLYRINPTTGIISQIGTLTGLGSMTGLMRVSGAQTVDAGPWGGAPLSGLALAAPVPNPSALLDRVTIRYSLAREGQARVAIHDVAGRRVWSHDAGRLGAGEHTVVWDGRGEHGDVAPVGIYFVKLVTDEGDRQGKLVRF